MILTANIYEALMRAGYSRVDALIYGAIVHAHNTGEVLGCRQMAESVNTTTRYLMTRLTVMEKAGLIKRESKSVHVPGKRGRFTKFVPLGPIEETTNGKETR